MYHHIIYIYVYTYYHYYVYTCHLHIIGLLCPPVFSFRFVKNTDEDLVRAVADVADAKVVHLQVQLAIFQGFHGWRWWISMRFKMFFLHENIGKLKIQAGKIWNYDIWTGLVWGKTYKKKQHLMVQTMVFWRISFKIMNPLIRTKKTSEIIAGLSWQDGADMDVAEDADFWYLGSWSAKDTLEELAWHDMRRACVQ